MSNEDKTVTEEQPVATEAPVTTEALSTEQTEVTTEVTQTEVATETTQTETTTEALAEQTETVVEAAPAEEAPAAVETLGQRDEAVAESLSVVQEVRNELAKAYVEHNQLNKQIESLSAEIGTLKQQSEDAQKTIETLTSELAAYKARDTEAANAERAKRLEALSVNFKKLGQEKTVEQLTALGDDVVTEFEKITQLALQAKSEETLSAPVTMPTQAMPAPAPVAQPVAQPKTVANMSTEEVMRGIISDLQKAQSTNKTGKKVTYL